jgi:hypothetical protein
VTVEGRDDLRSLLPRGKSDLDRARAVVARGYPAVAPVVDELLVWLQDCNWPVAGVVAPFLAGIGLPLEEPVRRVLATDDAIWKYWVLTEVVAPSRPLAAALRTDLERLATAPSADEVAEEVDAVARRILAEPDDG